MSTITDIFPSTSARDASKPAGSNIGLVVFRSDTKALQVSDGTSYFNYDYDSLSLASITNTNSLSFDGAGDYVNCGGATDFHFNDGSGNDLPFSVSAWVKLDNITAKRIASKDSSLSAREYLFGTSGNGRFNMLLGTGSVYINCQNDTVLNTTDWYHVVSTYDGSKTAAGIKVYVNGDASNLTTSTGGSYAGMPQTGGDLEIGRFANGNSFFDGFIDEVSIFDYELSQIQVSAIYNNKVVNNIGALEPLGWWRMGDNDNGLGLTITNQGSGNNNGSIFGATHSTTVPV